MEYTKTEVIDFLKKNPVISIAASVEDKPLASVVLTATDSDFTKYFACSKNSYKAKALNNNPKISWSVWENRQMLIQADGETEQLFGEDLSKALDKITETASEMSDFWPPVLSITDEDYAIFKINPKWLRAFDLRDLKMTENEPPFTIFEGAM